MNLTIFLVNCILALSLLTGVGVLVCYLVSLPARRRAEKEFDTRRKEFDEDFNRVSSRIEADRKRMSR